MSIARDLSLVMHVLRFGRTQTHNTLTQQPASGFVHAGCFFVLYAKKEETA